MMSGSKRKKDRHRRILAENPSCYFCGGVRQSTEIDHVPPQACFPKKYVPEGFEFAACKECNEGTAKEDLIFGFYSMLLDFDESKIGREDRVERLGKHRQAIINNYPDALPDLSTAYPLFHQVGLIVAPAAVALDANPGFKDASRTMGQKLTHAVYLRETRRILNADHRFQCFWYQPQQAGTEVLTAYFSSLFPDKTIGNRPNVKPYGDRFGYLSGFKEEEDFFMYAAQFGHGLILWGIVCEQNTKIPEAGRLASAPWSTGACGPGGNATTPHRPIAHGETTCSRVPAALPL
jgi:hypothetical protein